MLMILSAVLGAIIGWRRAARRGGNRLDRLQYAAAHALMFFILGLAVTLALDWLGVV